MNRFLSKGNTKADVQAKLVLEGIGLAENAGLFVDAVVMDGATWNRSLWTKFGLAKKVPAVSTP
jgi:hypothetical protein